MVIDTCLKICFEYNPLDDECRSSCYAQFFNDDYFWN